MPFSGLDGFRVLKPCSEAVAREGAVFLVVRHADWIEIPRERGGRKERESWLSYCADATLFLLDDR